MRSSFHTNPAKRLLYIFIARKWILLLGLIVGGVLAGIVGLTTPKVYRSTALVEIVQKGSPISMGATDYFESNMMINLNKANMAVRSGYVLDNVAKSIKSLNLPLDAIFPKRHSMFSVKARVQLAAERLGSTIRVKSSERELKNISVAVVSAWLNRHLETSIKRNISSLTISYSASNQTFAKLVCDLILKEFIHLMTVNDRSELTNKIEYLSESIELQMKKIKEIGKQRQNILEQYPEMASNDSSNSPFAKSFMEKRDRMAELQNEVNVNQQLIDVYSNLNKLEENVKASVGKEVRSKIIEQIGQLEFRILEFTQVQGYAVDHPVINDEKNKLKSLRGILRDLDKKALSKGGKKTVVGRVNIREKLDEIYEKNNRLEIERKLLEKDLTQYAKKLKFGLQIEYDLSSYNQRIQTHQNIVRELLAQQEKMKMDLAGLQSSTLIRQQPSEPLSERSLPMGRRIVFGSFMCMVFFLSLLFVLDLVSPKLFDREDFESLGIHFFGVFNFDKSSVERLASSLMGIILRREEKLSQRDCEIVLISVAETNFGSIEFIMEVAAYMQNFGPNVGVMMLGRFEDHVIKEESQLIKDIPFSRIHDINVTFQYGKLLGKLSEGKDIMLVIAENLNKDTNRLRILEHSHHLIHLAQAGVSNVYSVEQVNFAEDGQDAVDEHALLIA